MIKPARDDLTIYQGSTYDKRWLWRCKGQAVDLTGVILRAQVRPAVRASVQFMDMTTENGQLVIHDAPGGVFGISLTHEETADLGFNRAVYDLEVVWPHGAVSRLLYGEVLLNREVTR